MSDSSLHNRTALTFSNVCCILSLVPTATTMSATDRSIESAAVVYQELEAAWSVRDCDKVGRLLPQMKLLLLKLSFLPASGGSAVDKRELVLARNTLEIGALWSIEKKDIPSFQRYFAQLKCYYFDYNALLPDESAYKYQILGLNLLSLLAQNRVAEFHTELELLPADELRNVYIKHPISLEQFVMEGSFHKVFLSKGNVPAENYTYFIDILIKTIRDEIASCAEKAYTQVSVPEAGKMLMVSSYEELRSYTLQRKWQLDPDEKFFVFAHEEKKEKLHFVQNSMLISQSLGYARELEKIV